ncbi:DUF4328 domain-containing protein [Kitasatospora sp. NPDC058965]|uniref:DUF4328 domain-containing protein n=1 Tax=Kitasatospora sp. NPDC058965 TaxID=3346682 RepID=UPI0036CDE763
MDAATQQRVRVAHHRGRLTDPRGLAVAAQLLIAVQAVLDLAYAVTTRTGGPLLFPLARLQMPAYLAAGVVFLIWFWRCQRNAREIAPERLGFTPGGAVLVWFVPVLCLWQPRRATLDLVRVGGGAGTRLVNAWWTAWLAHLLGFPVLTVVYALAGYRDSGTPWLALPDTVAAILAVQLIGRITAAQRTLLAAR